MCKLVTLARTRALIHNESPYLSFSRPASPVVDRSERQNINKEIWQLESSDEYVAALKPMRDDVRWQKAAADTAEYKSMLKRQEDEKAAMLAEMTKARDARLKAEAIEEAARAAERAAQAAAEFDKYCTVKRIRKGDQVHVPKVGDHVSVTYDAVFAEGTWYAGEAYGGQRFDTTLKKEGKGDVAKEVQRPLAFRIGSGAAIRGLEEVLKTMSLGERVQATIDPQWAYKKGGLQDADGAYLVPPHATLIFDVQLVKVGSTEFVKKGARSPRLSGLGAFTPPSSPALTPTSPRSPALWPTGGAGSKSPKSPKSPASQASASPRAMPKMVPLPEALELS